MRAEACQKYIKMSPRKVRLVVRAVSGLTPIAALDSLPYIEKAAALPVLKVIKSAVSNAKAKGMKEENLFFEKIEARSDPEKGSGRNLLSLAESFPSLS